MAAAVVVALLSTWPFAAQGNEFRLPPSELSSEPARQAAQAEEARRRALAPDGARPPTLDEIIARDGMLAVRGRVDEARKALAAKLATDFPVTIRELTVGGIVTDVVEPVGGASANNSHRVLINLHGGGFFLGARYEGQIASIPVASLAGIKVVTVDYRQAPEHRFPAASEDVATVYRELLKSYRPENIGIYGCSAGGVLTAQAVAWFMKQGLPLPGAIAMDSGGALAGVKGDSYHLNNALTGVDLRAPVPPRGKSYLDTYYGQTSIQDPLQSPLFHKDLLAGFPPSLLISSTRDHQLSPVVASHARLVDAGVEARLHVWEGVGHCFTYDADLPESRQAYQVLIRFFDAHLGKDSR